MELNEIEKELIRNYRKAEDQDKIIIVKRATLFAMVAEKARREEKCQKPI